MTSRTSNGVATMLDPGSTTAWTNGETSIPAAAG